MDEPEGHPRVERMDERALPLDEQDLSPTPSAFDDEPLGCARQEVGDDGVDGDSPTRDRDPRLTGRHEDRGEPALARLEVELDCDGLLADRAVRADGEDDPRVHLEVRPARHAEPLGWLAQIAQRDPVLAGELGELGVFGDELVQAALDVEAGGDAVHQEVPPCRRKAATLRRHPDDGDRRLVRSRVLDASDDRDSLVCLPRPPRVEDRNHRIGPVAHDSAHRLAVVGVVGEALAEDEDATRPAHPRADTPRPGADEGSWTPSRNSTPGHGSSRSSRLPSRST